MFETRAVGSCPLRPTTLISAPYQGRGAWDARVNQRRENQHMNIGVSGASGHLGSATVRELKAPLGTKANIVAISRTPDKIATPGVETRAGDFDKPETLLEAFRGLEKLVIIPPSDMKSASRSRQASTAIDSAVAAGVRHITYLSAAGTRFATVPHLWESFFVPEQALMRSAAKEWSILRMAFYAESFLDRAKMSLAQGVFASSSSAQVNFVARQDVAAAAAGLIATEGHHGAIYNATGPETLDGPARAAVVAKATGKPFAFVHVPLEQLLATLKTAGLPPLVVDAFASIEDMWAKGAFDITTGDVARLAERAPRPLIDVAKEYLA
jgi:NAD(P)H dehydrogenase (quinone)